MGLFNGLTAEESALVARHASIRRLRANTVVCRQGETGSTLYLIRSGRVKRYIAWDDGREVVFDHLGPGDYFGEVPLLMDLAHPASVATLEETALVVIGRQVFLQCVQDHPCVLWNLARGLARRLSEMTASFAAMALEDCFGRVVKVLAEGSGEEDGLQVTSPLTQRDIAARIGCSREMVSRVMTQLRNEGYVRREGRRLVILNPLPRRR